ncbi:MAG TPA: hypothetical protein DCQ34_01355 [Chitinophagaceae bacterium]|nr:hypothetical protein [Chitinophagaceae bacterium]
MDGLNGSDHLANRGKALEAIVVPKILVGYSDIGHNSLKDRCKTPTYRIKKCRVQVDFFVVPLLQKEDNPLISRILTLDFGCHLKFNLPETRYPDLTKKAPL